jgi:hypothetical protein
MKFSIEKSNERTVENSLYKKQLTVEALLQSMGRVFVFAHRGKKIN